MAIFAAMSLVLFGGCAATDELSYHLSESSTDEPVGTYVAELPSASGMGRLIVLHLFENGNAIRTSVYIGEPQGDYVEEGTWSAKNDGVSIILKNSAGENVVLFFKVGSEGLRSTDYDETSMGKSEIKFTRVRGPSHTNKRVQTQNKSIGR